VRGRHRQAGSVLLLVVFLVALLAATVMGHLHVNAEELQLMQNHIWGVEALAIAEAGLNDALAQLRQDATWNRGFAAKPFHGGSYSVAVRGSTVEATGVTSRGFVARVRAEIAVESGGPPYLLRITALRINP
jgi:Tfp pilus assembly protein PilX